MIPIKFIAEMGNITPERMKERYSIQYAKTFWEYLIGLMFKSDFRGMMVFTYAKPINLFIHTCFMRFPLDITCYDEKNGMIGEVKNMAPWRFMYVKGVKWFTEKKHLGEE